jgi:hypothetical protein
MRNRLFQIAWNLLKQLIPRKKGDGSKLSHYKERIEAQIRLSQKFGGPDLVIIGDSNAENLTASKWMNQFSEFGLCINIAISGTRPDQWEEFLHYDLEHDLFDTLQKAKIILFNLGGNVVLQGTSPQYALACLVKLRNTFSNSYNCLIPPVHYDILAKLTGDKNIEEKFKQMNSFIQAVWENKTIDTYTPFARDPRTVWFIEGDLVHFNDLGNKLRIPIIKEALRKAQ